MYQEDKAVEVNLERSLYWFRMAIKQGHELAKAEYNNLFLQITEGKK